MRIYSIKCEYSEYPTITHPRKASVYPRRGACSEPKAHILNLFSGAETNNFVLEEGYDDRVSVRLEESIGVL